MADGKIVMQCEGCDQSVEFPLEQAGTVQECPECGGYLDVPGLEAAPNDPRQQAVTYQRQLSDHDRQSSECDRQQQLGVKQQEPYQCQLDRRDKLDERHEQLLDQAHQLVSRWQEMADHFEFLLRKIEEKHIG